MLRSTLSVLLLAAAACSSSDDLLLPPPPPPPPAPVVKLTLLPGETPSIGMMLGSSLQLAPRLTIDGVVTALPGAVSYTSTVPASLPVDAAGLVRALGMVSGYVTGSLMVQQREIRDSLQISVMCTLELRISLTPAVLDLAVGQTFQPTLTLSSCGGQQILSDTLTWTALTPGVVAVDARTGAITGLAPGTTTVRVTGSFYSFTAQLQVMVH